LSRKKLHHSVPARRINKAWKKAREFDESTIYETLQRQIHVIRSFQDAVAQDLLTGGVDRKEASRIIGDTSSSLSRVSRELLAFQKAQTDDYASMTQDELGEHMLAWFARLPYSKMERFLDRFQKVAWEKKPRPRPYHRSGGGVLSYQEDPKAQDGAAYPAADPEDTN